ncbi:bifunctional diguanylate cyclase/phosphodiesterase [Blastococcus sp. LR1]|uniref:putative bifunctional diguanylate cyclase/phosphodiesterase n=1 Tax=Blastococcus sp. LR1 TaxID=2877000 RepID=UPI001CCE9CDC|nr:EAL domain-containing protein [Blastococcus sp. LR1]MCA0144195.1 EAL domain-containing protein [Blastococcus sp. LR1]
MSKHHDDETPKTRRQVSPHLATVGLVAVLVLLAVFSIAAAVNNARAAAEATRSAEVSQWSEEAERQLALQEELADTLSMDADDEVWAEYDEAKTQFTHALERMGAVSGGDESTEVAEWLALHSEYVRAVDGMLLAGLEDGLAIDEYEEEFVDPAFEAIEEVVKEEAREHWLEATRTLEDLGTFQRGLLVATPVAFGVGLAMVAWFTVILTRSRRDTARQSEANRHQALHDALTGLPNRTLLKQRGADVLADDAEPAGLLLIDLDRFKEINDTLGHAYGDRVLQVVSDRLRRTLRAGDTVARLGGDEFAVLLPAVGDEHEALELAARVLAAIAAPIDVEGASLDVDASIGIALSGLHGDDVESLLQSADIAMYAAKARGLGVCVYDSGLNDHSPERLALLGDLRRAIDNGELLLHYQPKLSLSGGLEGVEALVRWQHPERGMVPPGAFVPLAERTPLIRALTRCVLDQALAQCARWRAEGRDLQVAVNVSARNLTDETFVDEVLALLARWDVPARFLDLEVTESAIMADPERARQTLQRLSEAGVVLSIDDFGAGYTSLGHLKDLPVQQLKIDRSFVADMISDRSDALIVKAVVELGHNLGLVTVAEGVEDQATWDALNALGCDVAQGYHMARPMPVVDLERWLDGRLAAVPV